MNLPKTQKQSHYELAPGLEAIDIIRQTLTAEQWKGFCLGNILKYRLRAGKKGDALTDLAKAKQYEEWMHGETIKRKDEASHVAIAIKDALTYLDSLSDTRDDR